MAAPLDPRLWLVARLADGDWHSGERLAQQAGLTRAGLARRMAKLAEWGLQPEARHGLGYRLPAALELLDAAALSAQAPAGWAVRVAAALESTSSALLDADPAQDPQALFAEYQSAGRGRRGRGWISPFAANLMLSVAWSFPLWPRDLSRLPLAVGVAVARAVQAACGVDLQIKWPNDLYLQERKLGGVLIEHRGETGGACRVVIGVGLNVAMREATLDQPWISLAEVQPVSRNRLAAALLQELDTLLAGYATQGFAPHAAAWSERDLTRDRAVRVLMAQRELEGIARGVDEQGALLVEVLGEPIPVHSADVSLRLG
jgi:BirA family transcriptional regulator, biotin operon repressor / biotin---[acetyl-CoA-carboxylase] ligase